MDLTVKLGPLTLRNPIITASGTFGYGLEFLRYGDLSALGGICLKGISLAPRTGNPMPRIAETPCGMLNAIGLQNVGVEKFLKEKLPYIPAGATLIANLYAQTPEDFGELAAIFSGEDKIAALEVNISCPNVREGGVQFGQDPHMASAVVGAVKKRAGSKPVIVKLSPNVTDVRVIARAAVDAGADMLSLINTLSGMAVDIRTRKSRLANVVGGLSGPAIKPVALRMVHQVVQSVNVPVIGMGGIVSAEDVLEFILVGAHAVQVGTYNFMRPDNAFRLVEEVRVLAETLGIESWGDYRGTLKV
ncbi:dihydroorotate dehydrogenase [Desulfomicrobium baculatum]|uniref:Dihydroorotate dehydrogenase n=1 Tax=Desulfomicrobium baculatum (strain DSM 4028 / VKM B-1378 / X) TaxID=525897 RepID=C7LUK6_DESBD|nr:dihydroorotate dehydrogenase [Desulfomicrobium baculatum]ACU90921.1 dihydroorotate dehydrogenase family protein [Desulfomicrobium baculatum DSM 4028]